MQKNILVSIIDYGSGNLHSVANSINFVLRQKEINAKVELATTASQIKMADKIILPGVGSFADCRAGLAARENMIEMLEQKVIKQAVPFLGICVGMQLMAQQGLEKTTTTGFGWLDGETVALPIKKNLKIPHMGWNNLMANENHSQYNLLKNINCGKKGDHAYFVHSYYFKTNEKDILATTDYGGKIAAIVGKDNYIGTQFHPEKSQKFGMQFLANFLTWQP